MLALIVFGKHKVRNMDVYLELVIDELMLLWEGIQMADISRPIYHRSFKLYGILCWTLHDYPWLTIYSGMYIYNIYH